MDQMNLAVINFDTVELLIPQGAVATIEMIDSMEADTGTKGAVGRLRSGGREWPVYALSADLSRRTECMASNKYCVAFEIDGQPAFSIACDEVSSLTLDSADQIKPLQSFMRNHGNPIEALVLKDDRLMFVSRVESMQKFLDAELAA
jgi:hypothetical protein